MNIVHLLQERLAVSENAVAIIDNSRGYSRRFTYAQLESASSHVAAQLRTVGLRPGEVVTLLQPVSAELYILLIAILRSGFIAQFIDPSAGPQHIDHCCSSHPPKAFIGTPRAHLLRFVSPALRRIPLKFSTGIPVFGSRQLNCRPSSAERASVVECSPDSPAMIRFTSGSTGQPKAVIRKHGFLLSQQRVIQRSFDLLPGETDLVTMPMFVLSNLAAGVASIIPHGDLRSPGAIQPAGLLRQIERFQPDRIGAAPVLLENLADHCAAHSRTMEGLRKIHTGGAPVFPQLLEKLAAVAPRANIFAVYGSTEAEPIAILERREFSPEDRNRMSHGAGLLAGFPDPAIQIQIVQDEETKDSLSTSPTPVPLYRIGQIMVAGPHVQPTQPNTSSDRTVPVEADGRTWHQTGDAGYFDEQGRLWLLGRCSARIRDDRGTLFPFQVECVAREHPSVRLAALMAHDNRRVLVIESKSDADALELKSKLEWAHIDSILRLSNIPVDKRHNSKIDYPALRSTLHRAR